MRLSASGQGPSPSPASGNRDQALDNAQTEIVLREEIGGAESTSLWRVMDVPAELMEKEGANTPIEGLRQVPFFLGTTQTENDSNGGNGTAFINLRALGSNNVLTLINGRRAFGFSNINAIPISALVRAEIVDIGIYGSDSVAGAVNFVMLNASGEKPHEGAELHALYGNTTDSDAHVRQVYLRGGVTGLDGKVSIAAAGEYYSRANLFSRDREIAATADTSNDPTGLGWGGSNNNSPTYGGRIFVQAGASALGFTQTGQLVLSDLTNNRAAPGAYRRFDAVAGTDPSRFNFRDFTPAIPAVEKAMYYVTGRYKIFGDSLQLYGDVMYSSTKQDNGAAGTPFAVARAANGLTEARASLFNPAGNFLSYVTYRLQQELGNRGSFFDSDYQRYVAGINGDFSIKDNGLISRFSYDSGFVYEDYQQQRIDSGDATRTAIRQAIAGTLVPGVFFNPFIGQFAPITGFAPTYLNGVPTGNTAFYDNRITAQTASYIGHSFFYERDFLADAHISAHLFPSLWNGGIDLLLGGEHRETQTHQVPDATQVAGDRLFFTASPNTKYKQAVDSIFGELSIPIITPAMQIPSVRALDVEGVFRFEAFEDTDQYTHATASFDNNGSPELGLRYQPWSDLTLRASWRQLIRPPTFDELFAPVMNTFPQVFGLPPPIALPPPLGGFTGGSPAVKPEKTDAYSAGIVWTPKFIPGFTLTMDWYQIFTRDVILGGADLAQSEATQYINSGRTVFVDPDGCGGGSGEFPGGGPGNGITDYGGNLFCIDALNSNIGKRLVQGLDMTSAYEIPTERFGKFKISGGYHHFFTWKAETGAGIGSHSFLGTYNNGSLPFGPGAVPRNKGFLRGEWEWRGFDCIATGNYIGQLEDDPSFIAGNTYIGGTPPDPAYALHRQVPSYLTLDMQLSYEWIRPAVEVQPAYAKDAKEGKNVMQTVADTSTIWERMLWGTKLTIGVNNAFDRNPPSVLAAPNDNYDTSLYSIRNRYYYIAFDKKF